MAARVDARASVVRVGDDAIPFAVDCGEGIATFDPQGEPRHLRILRWREKRGLARFAGAGEAFVERHFLALCAGGAAETDPVRREALAALASWLHAPDGDSLPLDCGLLAEATVGLCGRLGLSPSELAEMAAADVEALWRAAQGFGRWGDPEAAPPAPDVTRILVRPDPAETGAGETAEPAKRHPVPPAGEPPVDGGAVSAEAAGKAPDPVRKRAGAGAEAAGKAPDPVRKRAWAGAAADAQAARFRVAMTHPADPAGRRAAKTAARLDGPAPVPSAASQLSSVPPKPTGKAGARRRPGHAVPAPAPATPAPPRATTGYEARRGGRADARAGMDGAFAAAAPPPTAPLRARPGLPRDGGRAADRRRRGPTALDATLAANAVLPDPAEAPSSVGARVASLIEMVTRSAEARDPAPTAEDLSDDFARRLAEAAGEYGIRGGE